MADHAHKQIRDAAEVVLSSLPTTQGRVFANRVWPLSGPELPAIRIYTESEGIQSEGFNNQFQTRELVLLIEACAKVSTTLDDTLDQIGLEIEVALSAGLTVGTRTLYPVYAGMNMDIEELDKPVGIKRHRYVLSYASVANQPDLIH